MKQKSSLNKIPVYYIRMEYNCQSLIYGGYCGQEWSSIPNCDTKIFNAVTSADVHRRKIAPLDEIKRSRSGVRPFTLTEKCVWHSHLHIWKKIKRHPLKCGIVAEHDALPNREKFKSLSVEYLKERAYDESLHCRGYIPLSFNDTNQHHLRMHMANAYFITDKWIDRAEKFIVRVYKNLIDVNTDGFIASLSKKMQREYFENNIDLEDMWVVWPTDIMYSIKTIEHSIRNENEEIDIPGLRW